MKKDNDFNEIVLNNDKCYFHILHINIRSLSENYDEFLIFLDQLKYKRNWYFNK